MLINVIIIYTIDQYFIGLHELTEYKAALKFNFFETNCLKWNTQISKKKSVVPPAALLYLSMFKALFSDFKLVQSNTSFFIWIKVHYVHFIYTFGFSIFASSSSDYVQRIVVCKI